MKRIMKHRGLFQRIIRLPKKFLILNAIIVISLFSAGCTVSSSDPSLPRESSPSETPTQLPTQDVEKKTLIELTPSLEKEEPTPSMSPESQIKIGIPQNLVEITEESIPLIQELSSIGNGKFFPEIIRYLISNNGQHMLVQHKDGVSYIDLHTGEIAYILENGRPVTFTPDNQQFLLYVHNSNEDVLELHRNSDGTLSSMMKGLPPNSLFYDSMERQVVFSPDSRFFAAVPSDKTIKIWDTESGSLIFTLQSAKDDFNPRNFRFSSNGKYFVASQHDGLEVWSTLDGEKILDIEGDIYYAFSNDNIFLFVKGSSGTQVWNLQDRTLFGKTDVKPIYINDQLDFTNVLLDPVFDQLPKEIASELKLFMGPKYREPLPRMVFRKIGIEGRTALDNRLFFSEVSPEGTIRLMGIDPAALPSVLIADSAIISVTALSQNGKQLAGLDSNGVLWIWDVERRAVEKNWQAVPGFRCIDLCFPHLSFSEDGSIIAVTSGSGEQITVWSVEDGTLQDKLMGESGKLGYGIISPDKRYIAYRKLSTSVVEGQFAVYDLSNKEEVDIPVKIPVSGYSIFPPLAFSPNGSSLVINSQYKTQMEFQFLDTTSWTLDHSLPAIPREEVYSGNYISPILFSPTGNFFSEGFRVWETGGWNEIWSLRPEELKSHLLLALSDSGEFISATNLSSNDDEIDLVHINGRLDQSVASYKFNRNRCGFPRFSPDWKFMACIHQNYVQLIDLPFVNIH
jgi:WD40 repeat protein